MIAAENETLLPVPVSRVWNALITFDRYPRWNSWFSLRGEAQLGAKIGYVYATTRFAKRPVTISATIVALEPMRLFTLQTRVPGLFRITERFTLEPHAGGTMLRHRMEYRGLFMGLFPGVGRRGVAALGRVDAALRAYVIKEQNVRGAKALRRPSRKPRPR